MSSSNTESVFQAIQALPIKERLRLLERVLHQIAEQAQSLLDGLIGLLQAQEDVLDQVVEDAMLARERDPLRR